MWCRGCVGAGEVEALARLEEGDASPGDTCNGNVSAEMLKKYLRLNYHCLLLTRR